MFADWSILSPIRQKLARLRSDFDVCEPQFQTVEKSLTEEFIEGRHFVCAIDEVNHEHLRGFRLRLTWKDLSITMMRIVGMCQHLNMKEMKPCPQI